MGNYEATVILHPGMAEQHEGVIEKLQDVLVKGGAKMRQVVRWGRRTLAHPIEKQAEGIYVIYFFTMEKAGDTLTSFERICKIDDAVMRQMIVDVPTKKHGTEIKQIVPEPGWMADFVLMLRQVSPRRRDRRDPRRHESEAPPSDSGPSEHSESSASSES